MKDLLNGKEGSIHAQAKFAKRDNQDGDAPDWGPPQQVTLRIERRAQSLPARRGRPLMPGDRAGDILTLNVADFPWAEYGERDRGEGPFINQFLCEEYRMEILSVGE